MKIAVSELKGTPLESYAVELEALAEQMRNQPRGKSIKKLGFEMGRVMRRMVKDTRGAENTSQ
ncbi:MAG: hypothetical protein KME16_28085 [Scytolyngbya sp. HA4215-MV1]|nr:hypothetical protein [Scytolyngbya sp. HA4215-MV1]